MSCTLSESFPQELVELVISHLAADQAALKACTLVCQSFSVAAQRHLFHTISLTFNTPRLIQVRDAASPQVSLVRRLAIEENNPVFDSPSTEQLIVDTLRRLPNLIQIELMGQWLDTRQNTGLSNEIVLRECCRPTVNRLSLICIHIYRPELLQACASLPHLTLGICSFSLPSGSESHSDTSIAQQIRLSSLTIGGIALPDLENDASDAIDFFLHPSCPFSLDNLRSLVIFTATPEDYMRIHSFTQSQLQSITSFTIIVDSDSCEVLSGLGSAVSDPPMHPIDLSKMPKLERLTLYCDDSMKGDEKVAWVITHLATIPQSGNLTRLTLPVQCEGMESKKSWSTLDDCLIRFISLREVDIKVHIERQPWQSIQTDSTPTTRDFFYDALAKTSKEKSLNVEFVSKVAELLQDLNNEVLTWL
ncbi:hypothetical protein AX16_004284 [Volvariella volvacea WC 439]|nr:hypothetical protein AX16_004284 [Volvariella volvacea WC 439]